ncbi:hypothetical protein Hypma_003109 [Hypsizygus marmoreus]|uniref:Uncharacterized protein n=1 Tax=Hypsizygus marmoreus TaxID=39966 RepID=A0A369J2E9_HYPMA|nr:hypothetical protein Hypma_003109 [Hypsizygus marmoreus]
MSRPPSPNSMAYQSVPSQHSYSSDPPLQSLLPAPRAFIPLLINKLKLDPSYTNELFAFLEVAFFMTDDQLRAELFKLAVEFRTYHALTTYQANYTPIKETLEQADIKNACRTVVWDPTRTDYTNPAVVEAALAHLKSNSKTNAFKGYFDSLTQARSDALKSQVGLDASYIKGNFRTLIKQGILGDGSDSPTCLTDNVSEGARKFLQPSPNVQHAFHILIVRAFARANSGLLQDSNVATDRTSDHEDVPATPAPATRRKLKKRKLTGSAARGSDFATRLTFFFAEKEDLWGNDIAVGGWKGFIDQAIKDEERNHYDDEMPLIPRRPSLPALTPITNHPAAAQASAASPAYMPQPEYSFSGCAAVASPVMPHMLSPMMGSSSGPRALPSMLAMPQAMAASSFFGTTLSHYDPVHSAAERQDGWSTSG